MSHLILTLLAAVGMTYIITDGSIFSPIRSFFIRKSNAHEDQGPWGWASDLIRCPQCMSFWSGVCIEGFKFAFSDIPTLTTPFWLSMFMVGCATSGCVFFLPKLFRGE